LKSVPVPSPRRVHSEPGQPLFKKTMKSNIHPKWNHAATVTCSCGNVFATGSQQDAITVDICSACHPFFTGEMRFVDRQGRVDKFMQKMNAAQQKQAVQNNKQKKKVERIEEKLDESGQPLSYKQLLQLEQTKMKNVNSNRSSEDAKAAAPKVA
jgi:large subunit ribosomal protein L31